jgi:flagellar motor protein MotB
MRYTMLRLLFIITLISWSCLSHAEDKAGMFEELMIVNNNIPQTDKTTICETTGTTNTEIAVSQKNDESEEVTVTGEDKLKLTTKKPLLELKENMNDAVPPYNTTEERLLSEALPAFSIWSQDYSIVMDSKQVASPCLKKLVKDTVATFYPQTKGEVITSWNLVITDDKGREFKKFKGTYVLPNSLPWNGRNDKDKIIDVDTTYTYIFSYIDVVGSPHTIVGNPFSIDALAHQEKNGLVITLSSKVLFDPSAEDAQIKPDAMLLIQEVADEIKNYFGLPIEIEVYDDNTVIADAQAEIISNLLSEKLIIWKEQIKTSTHRIKKQKPCVNIIVVNR